MLIFSLFLLFAIKSTYDFEAVENENYRSLTMASVISERKKLMLTYVASFVAFQRHKTCASIIEQDNKCRENLGLPTPSLDDLRANRGVKIIRGSKRKDLLIRLGVIPQKRRSYAYDNRGSSDKKRRLYYLESVARMWKVYRLVFHNCVCLFFT